MTKQTAEEPIDARRAWSPPRRPAWLERVNEEGRWMGIPGIIPLQADELIKTAMRDTGLSDFGDNDWREPFGILCKSLEEDADLNFWGRIRSRFEMLLLLENRLRIEQTYKEHPEIDDEVITKPLMVIGQGRSGTSFLLNLLSANPENGNIMTWEALFPCPPPEAATYETDERIERGHKIADQWNRVVPEVAAMHEHSGYIPQEDVPLLAHSFRNIGHWMVIAPVHSYNAYLATADIEPAYRYHKRILKLLQWKNPRKQWVLKNSASLEELATIIKVYPDVCIVWPHRDPMKSVASTISILGTMLWGQTDHPFTGNLLDQYMDPHGAAKRLTNVIDLMEAGIVPKDRVCNVLYQDLIADPVATAEKIHAYFGLPFSDGSRSALTAYIHDNPRNARPSHQISSETRAVIDAERSAFGQYMEYFKVPDER